MANIQSKQIIAGTATQFKAAISWSDIENLDSWEVSYQFLDVNNNVIKSGTQPIPRSVLISSGMTLQISNSLRNWVAQQANVTLI